jgi:glycosyltransferase involved in cell wall biosynthesis
MARIAFLDRIAWDYRVDTPRLRPLGGSQSALCYLAEALAALGHEVRMVTQTTAPGRLRGVDCLSAASGGYALFDGAEVAIVLNDPDPSVAAALRARLGPGGLVVLWTQHDVDQPAMASFAEAERMRAWDAVVLVSDWQRRAYLRAFGLDPARSAVFGNAMAPAFEGLFDENASVAAAKRDSVLAYASTPFRGLDVLLDAFPQIRARCPDARLRVHSSLGVYQVAEAQDAYRPLYERCRAMAGVDYRGAVPQPALAASLKEVACFAYPSTFPETFCTAVLEAMAAGCLCVVGDLGALPETTQGLAELVPLGDDAEDYARRFAERVVAVLGTPPEAAAERRDRQLRHLAATATWPLRARAWSGWLQGALAVRRA